MSYRFSNRMAVLRNQAPEGLRCACPTGIGPSLLKGEDGDEDPTYMLYCRECGATWYVYWKGYCDVKKDS